MEEVKITGISDGKLHISLSGDIDLSNAVLSGGDGGVQEYARRSRVRLRKARFHRQHHARYVRQDPQNGEVGRTYDAARQFAVEDQKTVFDLRAR